MEVSAARFQGGRLLGLTHYLFPDTISFENGRIRITTRKWLGLSKDEYEAPATRVSSVRLTSGIFNSTLVVETFGGAQEDLVIDYLPKAKARHIADAIRGSLR